MKESYRESIANHPGPEPCEGNRKAALEALDRGAVGRVWSSEILRCGEPTASGRPEGNNTVRDIARRAWLRGAEDPMHAGKLGPSGNARTGRFRGRRR
jgi:hypothetical protein